MMYMRTLRQYSILLLVACRRGHYSNKGSIQHNQFAIIYVHVEVHVVCTNIGLLEYMHVHTLIVCERHSISFQ